MLRSRATKILIALACAAATLVAVGAWTVLRVEDIPEQLPEIDRAIDPMSIVIPGSGLPDLVLADLGGKTTFFVVEGKASMEGKEGRLLNRALNRWQFPATTQGYVIGDAEGLSLLSGKIDEVLGYFRPELRFPLYADYHGAFLSAFKLPKGHTGFVVIDPDGSIAMRHTGPMTIDRIEQVRELLGADEPEPGPPAPHFSAGPLDNRSCAGIPCVLAFFGKELSRDEVPRWDDEAKLDEAKAREAMKSPDIRLLMNVQRMPLRGDAKGVVVGRLEGFEHELETWARVPDEAELRQAFGIEPDQTALVVLDREGRVAFSEKNWFASYRTGRIAEILGAEFVDSKPGDDGEDP